jgi:hypothetical protein
MLQPGMQRQSRREEHPNDHPTASGTAPLGTSLQNRIHSPLRTVLGVRPTSSSPAARARHVPWHAPQACVSRPVALLLCEDIHKATVHRHGFVAK